MKVEIEKIVHGGYGLARFEVGVCLVPYSVPGDLLDVEIAPGGSVFFGRIRGIEHPSSFRKTAQCDAFGICGGCDFDNMEYSYELEVKRGILVEDLVRIAGMEALELAPHVIATQYRYRNHAQFKVDEEGTVGFFKRGSRDVVGLPQSGCLLLQSSITDYVAGTVEKVRFCRGGFRIRSNSRNEIFKKGIPGIQDDRFMFHYVGGMEYRVGIDDFFQVNTAILEKWLHTIETYIEPHWEDTCLDFFCGSGLISMHMARKVSHVIGFELNPRAIESARYNAERNGLSNITFIRKDVTKGVGSMLEGSKVIVDPPRYGLSQRLLRDIVRMQPSIIVYVSCNTATFARDVSIFRKEHYMLQESTIVDMFPRTKHLETVARLVRISHKLHNKRSNR